MSHDPATQANAHTLPHDPFEVLSQTSRAGRTPIEQASGVAIPTLVLCGSTSAEWMVEAGRQIADAMPHGQYQVLQGQGHVVPAEILAPVLTDYLGHDAQR